MDKRILYMAICKGQFSHDGYMLHKRIILEAVHAITHLFNCKGMSGNNISNNGGRSQQPDSSNGAVFDGARSLRVLLDNLFTGDMELKLLIGVLYAIGVPSYIWGILLNAGTWKGDVLFGTSMALMIVYAYFLIRKLKDNDTMRKLKIRKELREFERGAGDAPAPGSEKFNNRIDRLNNDSDMFRNFK